MICKEKINLRGISTKIEFDYFPATRGSHFEPPYPEEFEIRKVSIKYTLYTGDKIYVDISTFLTDDLSEEIIKKLKENRDSYIARKLEEALDE